jgi:TrmH family RNA methyltransferase
MALSKEKARLLERLRRSRLRSRERQFLVEGVRGAREFLHGELQPEIRFAVISPRLAVTEAGYELRSLLLASGVPLDEVSDREMEGLSQTDQPQGVLLVVREPTDPLEAMGTTSASGLLLLDGIQDPGNVGTLIRAARTFGLRGVMALEGTVDPFNPKVVRASAGAMAHIPVARLVWTRARAWLAEREISLLVADAGGKDIRSVGNPSVWALAVGNEGAGARPELMEAGAEVVGIPMAPGVDSLNAGIAGAILLFVLTPSTGNDTES